MSLRKADQELIFVRKSLENHGFSWIFHGLSPSTSMFSALAQALATAEQAATIFKEIKDRRGEATALLLAANVYKSVGEFDEAEMAGEKLFRASVKGGEMAPRSAGDLRELGREAAVSL